MSLVASNLDYPVEKAVLGTLAFDSSYPTGGEAISAAAFGLARFTRIEILPTGATAGGAGYVYCPTIATDGLTANILVFRTAAATPAGTNATSAVTGTGTFTGTSPVTQLDYSNPVFSGTGQSCSGQVITTTDNKTMTADQCTGMWFVSATHGPYLIASNTAVTGAQAVLTIYGTAPTTDAGTYKILKGLTPVGTVSALSGTAAGQVFTGTAIAQGVLAEVTAATSLAALTAVPGVFYGY